jgi:putative aldouronate transport system permease protein
MSTINEKSTFGRKKGIRDIPENLRKGYRMAPGQLRFCVVVTVVLVLAVFIVMSIAGGNANRNVAINEEALVLLDAVRAERIEAEGQKSIHFADSPVYDGNGKRLILTEKVVTSRNYWVVMCPDSEINAYESVIGTGRFLPLDKIGNNSIWIVMATDDEMNKCIAAVEGSGLVQLNAIENNDWLNKGTDEENKKAAEAFGNMEFIQFEKLGTTSIRLRRGTDSQIAADENAKSSYRMIRLVGILLLFAAAGLFAYTIKSGKMQKKPEGTVKAIRYGALAFGLAMLVLVVLMTVQMDNTQDRLVRESPMIMAADGEVLEEDEVVGEDSDQKFSYVDTKKADRTVTIPKQVGGTAAHRVVQYAALALLGILLFGMIWFFRYERDLGFPAFNTILLIVLMIITVYPVLNTLATSFNDGTDALRGGIGVLPRKFSMVSYNNILSKDEIFDAAWVSASKTVIITFLNLLLTGMLSYALSRREYVLRKFITTVMVLTMYVNAGLIPTYLLISRTLNLAHTYWVYIIPTMLSCFNMIVIRTYITGLPDALVESARIDGAGDFRIYWKIIFPLCTPVLATVALFVAVGSWNSWFDTRLYNAGQKDPKTLQYLLQMKILTAGQNSNAANTSADALKVASKTEPITIRAAITVVSTVPILVVYPFLQKYFVTGMALGSVKG